MHYVFRANYERFRRVRVTNVSGDFREHDAVWELRPVHGGEAVIVTYRVHIVPRAYVPGWIMRSTMKRDLPEMLKALRARCESQAKGRPDAAKTDASAGSGR
jgi:hypothetical protein